MRAGVVVFGIIFAFLVLLAAGVVGSSGGSTYYSYLPLVMKAGGGEVWVGETAHWDEGYGMHTLVGLVQNDTSTNVSGIRVAVELKDSNGQQVASLVADVPAWRLAPETAVCWKAVVFASGWSTYTARVADYTRSGTDWPEVYVASASLSSSSGWPVVTGEVRNASAAAAYDAQVTAWLRNDGILADCISEITGAIPAGQATSFVLYASRLLTGTVALDGTYASARSLPPMPTPPAP